MPGLELVNCATLLEIQVKGFMSLDGCKSEWSSDQKGLPRLVVAGNGPSLWGRNWLNKTRLDWGCTKQIQTGLQSLVSKYAELFREELGTLKGVGVKLVVPKDATTKFFKPH